MLYPLFFDKSVKFELGEFSDVLIGPCLPGVSQLLDVFNMVELRILSLVNILYFKFELGLNKTEHSDVISFSDMLLDEMLAENGSLPCRDVS